MLTDRQRIEVALPTRMLFTIAASRNFGCYDAEGKVVDATGHEVVRRLRDLLKGACLEPIADLPEGRGYKLARRIERVHMEVTSDFDDQSAVKLTLAILYFTQTLIDAEALVLIEGSPVSEAVDILLPMAEHGLENDAINRSARKQARRLLERCQSQGLYRGVQVGETADAA